MNEPVSVLNLCFTKKQKEKLRKLSEEKNVSMSIIIREAFNEYIEKEERENLPSGNIIFVRNRDLDREEHVTVDNSIIMNKKYSAGSMWPLFVSSLKFKRFYLYQ